MKHILFVVNHLKGGGIERTLLDLLSLLHKDYKIDVLSVYDCNSVYKRKISELAYSYYALDNRRGRYSGIPVIKSLYSRIHDNSFFLKICLNSYIRSKRYDTIISFADGMALDLVAASRTSSRKIAWIHSNIFFNCSPDKEAKLSKRLRNHFRKMDKIVCVSNAVKAILMEKIGCTFPYITIYNIVNIENIKKEASAECGDTCLTGKKLIVSVGRLSYEKGFDILIESMSMTDSEKLKQLKLWIIGDGVEKENLSNLIKRNNLEDVVELKGFQENPYSWLSKADLVVVPSRSESFGLVIVESFVLGKPVLALSSLGPDELLDNGKYGELVKCCSPGALSASIQKVLFNKELLNHYSLMAVERARFFEVTNIEKKLRAII